MFPNPTASADRTIYRILSCLFLAGMLLFLCPGRSVAQEQDSTAADTLVHKHSPRKAVIYSLLCPGLGQVYNKKYWKIPFIYGAGGAFLYYVNYNQLKYKKFRDALNENGESGSAVIDGYKYSNLDGGMNFYRRNRDLSVAGLAAIYLLNVIDAMVDAHFFYYDVSDDLSMKVEPTLIQSPGMTASIGLRINLGF